MPLGAMRSSSLVALSILCWTWGMRMVWLIIGLLLALAGGVAVVTQWGGRRLVADDTLVAELLGPPLARPSRTHP